MFQGGSTGGAPGSPTFSWQILSSVSGPPVAPIPASMVNPTDSSSQRFSVTGVGPNVQATVTFRLTVTDPASNVSTQDGTYQYEHNPPEP